MRRIVVRSVVLAILAAGLSAIGTSSAGAFELCSVAEEPCPAESALGEGTVIKAAAPEATLVTGSGTVTCKESALEATTTSDAGSPLPAYIETLSFSKCTLSKEECTVTAAHTPYYVQIEETGTETGTFTAAADGAGNPAVTVKCGGTIGCTFSAAKLGLSIAGGEPAFVKATSMAFSEKSGSPCPKEGSTTLTASYKVTAPAQDRLVPVTTKLCTSPPNGAGGCDVESRYNNGVVESELASGTKAEFISTTNTTKKIVCDEGPLSGENFANNGTGGKITVMKFESAGTCDSTFPGEPTVKVEAETPPFIQSSFSFKTASRAVLTVTGPSPILKIVVEEALPVTCTYRSTRESWASFAYGPMKIKGNWQGARTAGAEPCPTFLKLKSESILTAPGGVNLWVTK